MKAVVVKKLVKTVDELKVIDTDVPKCSDSQVLVDVKAIGLNFFDILMCQGKYQIKPPLPFIPGAEFAGVVSQVGSRVKHLRPGQRVFGSISHGTYAEKVAVPGYAAFPMPPSMTFEEAAGFSMVYATSYLGLVHRGGLKASDTVLIHAAAGGVGLAAVQIAKAKGAKVIGTCGSAAKCQVLREQGVDLAINYREHTPKQWAKLVKDFTGGRGADLVYDPVGLVEESTKCIAWKGRLLIVGFAGGTIPKLSVNRILLKNISVIGVFLGSHMMKEPQVFGGILKDLGAMHAKGQIKPVVYKQVFGLDQVADALMAIASRASYGKVIMKPDVLTSRL